MGEAKAQGRSGPLWVESPLSFLPLLETICATCKSTNEGTKGGEGRIKPQWRSNTEWVKGCKDGQGVGRENKATIDEKHGRHQGVKGLGGGKGEPPNELKHARDGWEGEQNQCKGQQGQENGQTTRKRPCQIPKTHEKWQKHWTPNPTQGIVLHSGAPFAGTVLASLLRPSGQQRTLMPPYWGIRRQIRFDQL